MVIVLLIGAENEAKSPPGTPRRCNVVAPGNAGDHQASPRISYFDSYGPVAPT
jgi:hypothetical protein